MNKFFRVACCAVGGGLIGFFANQLHTTAGCICFAVGVALLTGAIAVGGKKNGKNR